ncbi:sporulation protein Cse60 [Sporosarcina ureilytica]|uniref:sporulation protein Cse60 n=1 Tax=Sporosarcina ureilytica TaxID=298596 RepID=UPI0012DB2538|nr:sporulation protein Cse60 [Sporosarcina ureilytica]
MKVKTFQSWSESKMDKKVNDFLSNHSIEIIDIKYASPIFFFSAMVIYKEKTNE